MTIVGGRLYETLLSSLCFFTGIYREGGPSEWESRRAGRSRRRATCGPQSRSELLTFTHYDTSPTRDISAGNARSHPRPRLSESSRLLHVRVVPSQRRTHCPWA